MTVRPAPRITVLRSAKSTFTSPGRVTRSVTPCTAWRRTSSASEKDSVSGVFFCAISRSLSFGTTMSASTSGKSFSMPSSA